MENARQQFVERLKAANNILVTVSTDPSVDQLSAAIGLTLMLNKIGKHGTAVFSGKVPSTIEFLQPEKTIEKNTDSLRDFIIALDKSKADKLRYKVEEEQVRIFITPYRTSITEADLDFSQGDFNVEVVVALGVTDQKDLDRAITAHGRILHDATTFALTNGPASSLGSVNWADADTSSLCEMVSSLAKDLQADVLDEQIATALLTGIVAETDRFSNQKTSSTTMSTSALLMNAGANQQLVASKLENEHDIRGANDDNKPGRKRKAKSDDDDHHGGALQIDHEEKPTKDKPEPKPQPESDADQLFVLPDLQDVVEDLPEPQAEQAEPTTTLEGGGRMMFEPPVFDTKLTANTEPEPLEPSVDPLIPEQRQDPVQDLDEPAEEAKTSADDTQSSDTPVFEPPTNPEPSPYIAPPVQTLSDLEVSVGAQHSQSDQTPAFEPPVEDPAVPPQDPIGGLGDARSAVDDALASITNAPLPPIDALNSQPLDLEIKQTGETGIIDPALESTVPGTEFTMPENLVPTVTDLPVDATGTPVIEPSAPPTVPPPFMPNLPDSTDENQEPQVAPQPPNNPFGLPPA